MIIANNGTLKEQMEIFRQKHEKRRNIEKTKLYSMWSFSRSAASIGGNGLINKKNKNHATGWFQKKMIGIFHKGFGPTQPAL